MRGLTPRERSLLAQALDATRRGGGLHVYSRGDVIVMNRLERRGAAVCSSCEYENDDHFTVTAIGVAIIELDARAEAPLPPGCL